MTDRQGDALDYPVDDCIVSFRRHGHQIHFGIVPPRIVWLTPEQAEHIGTNLTAAAEAARRDPRSNPE